ncbi:MAG TPA: S53 family peptidase, partial [Silvibacterium sp.]|nr:S53 family peptidase [Silvibacterium sp.]
MLRKNVFQGSLTALALLSLSLLASRSAIALTQTEHNVPKGVEIASDRGRVDPNQELNLTVVLKLHNEAAFNKVVEDLYDPQSSNYHHWLTASDLEKYAPTAAEFETVKKELVSHGYSVVSSDPQRFSIRVHGTAGITEEAFQTELHTFSHNGKVFQAHIRDAQLTGEAGKLVDSVAGLERHQIQPLYTIATNPRTGKPLFKKALTTADIGSTLLSTITGTALSPAAEFTFPTPGSALPIGVFYGNVYDINPSLVVSYTPAQFQKHYGLTPLIKSGYDGTGQTVALVEAYGYAAAESDANVAAAAYKLPALTSSNFSVVYPEGKPLNPNAADLTGWTTEIALDIQSAHAIAPGAKILVVASAGQDNEDQIASLQYIISHKLAYTVSSSWENDDEIISGPAEENAFNSVLKLGAAAGISFQFSTGDGGDLGLGTPVGDVAVPSNSPWATAVGGTSILNNPNGGGDIVAGWGNNIVYVNAGGVLDPPFGFFYAGAGGGESLFFSKPSWQHALPGTGRQVPDVSADADPFTGFSIIFTSGGTQFLEEGIGGTSLASPIFSAIWAIADQYNGAPLGHAGQAVAKLKAGQITDVLPTSSLNATDVTGTIIDSNGATFYSADALYAGLGAQTQFPSAIWPILPNNEEDIAISFGTDSSLTVTPGWDNVTGYGEPNGLPFIQGVSGKTTGAPLV